MRDISSYIDATLLASTATEQDICVLCDIAKQYGFASVCVSGQWVSLCAHKLQDSISLVCTVVGFPLGAQDMQTKSFEASVLVDKGASEIDMVVALGAYFSKDYDYVANDIGRVYTAVHEAGKKHKRDVLVKVILETCYLKDEDIIKLCEICTHVGVEFVKTSTGFGTAGATKEHVALMARSIGDGMKVKAAGGIRNYETAMIMIDAGACRIGTSAGVEIVKGVSVEKGSY